MDSARYLVRDHRASDFEAESRISRAVDPGSLLTAEELRHQHRLFDPPVPPDSAPRLYLRDRVVEERSTGEVVAIGWLFNEPTAFDPDRYHVAVQVDPAHRGRGIGSELVRELEGVAATRRAKVLMASARIEDPTGPRFLASHGYTERRRTMRLVLDLAERIPPLPEPDRERWGRDGVRFATLENEGVEREPVRRALYALCSEAELDVPRLGGATASSYAQFQELFLGMPGFQADAVFLAAVGERYVAMTSLERRAARSDTIEVGFTGTARAYRGRGLATEVKRRAVEYARAKGFRYLMTGNDEANRPIGAINARLGFRPTSHRIQAEKVLGAPRE